MENDKTKAERDAFRAISDLCVSAFDKLILDVRSARGPLPQDKAEEMMVLIMAHLSMEAFDFVYGPKTDLQSDDIKAQCIVATRRWIFLSKEVGREHLGAKPCIYAPPT